MNRFWKRSGRFLVRYGCQILFVVALVLLGLSYMHPNYGLRLRRQKSRVERSLHKRELLAERYTYQAMQAADKDWIDFDDLPDDIVLYCYQAER
jgi:site-specific recombinase